MDSGRGRKRPWESQSPVESQNKRRESPAVATYEQAPLPHHAGQRSHDSKYPPRLPSLNTHISEAASASCAAGSAHIYSSAYQISDPSNRSQSLVDPPSQHPGGHWRRSRDNSPRGLERDLSLPSIGSGAYRPQCGTDQGPSARGGGEGEEPCCSPGCMGQECIHARTLLRRLADELMLLDGRVGSLLQKDHRPSTESPNPEQTSLKEVLEWTLGTIAWSNLGLREYIEHSTPRSPDHNSIQDSTTMRGYNYLETRDEQSPPARPFTQSYPGIASFSSIPNSHDPNRNILSSNNVLPNLNSPHRTASSSGSVLIAPHSPMQAPHSTQPSMLPSPASMQYSTASNLPPISPPAIALAQTSAHSAFLQDLQHQISVKTIAFQTLQREYDSLLQKLDRQRTKCATLEKKFEVSDVELNSLTDDRERLQMQVAALEEQVEELQEGRDESRRQLVANGAQYMRIMEMANRLQAQSAEDKKRWDVEKTELQQRIKILEEAMVTGMEAQEGTRSSPVPSIVMANASGQAGSSSSAAETISVLRAEVGRLRFRCQTLETSLRTTKEESEGIQEAVKKVMEACSKMDAATERAVG